MKSKKSVSKYLLYTVCSAAAVLAATFYFHISDSKKNTTTVIIESHNDVLTTEVSEIHNIKLLEITYKNNIKENTHS